MSSINTTSIPWIPSNSSILPALTCRLYFLSRSTLRDSFQVFIFFWKLCFGGQINFKSFFRWQSPKLYGPCQEVCWCIYFLVQGGRPDSVLFLACFSIFSLFLCFLFYSWPDYSCSGFLSKYGSQRRTSKYALGILFNNFSRIYIWPITQLFRYLNYYVTVYFFLVFYISTAVTYPRFIYDFSFRYCLPNIGINSFLFLMYQSYLPQYMIDISRG